MKANSRTVCFVLGCVSAAIAVGVTGTTWGFASEQARSLAKVSAQSSSPDGKETVSLLVAEPWANAGQRIVILSSASVTDSNLPALGIRKASDTGLGSDAFGMDGEHYHFSARPKSGTWTTVTSASDVDLEVTALQQRKR